MGPPTLFPMKYTAEPVAETGPIWCFGCCRVLNFSELEAIQIVLETPMSHMQSSNDAATIFPSVAD